MQWKQLNCRTDCRYFCMMRREGEMQSLGLSAEVAVLTCLCVPGMPCADVILREITFFHLVLDSISNESDILRQEPLSAALSAVNLFMQFIGWLSLFLLVNCKLPLRPQTKRTYYEYTSLWYIYAILSINAWFWSSIFHTRYEGSQSLRFILKL